jgi:hypothetical protein
MYQKLDACILLEVPDIIRASTQSVGKEQQHNHDDGQKGTIAREKMKIPDTVTFMSSIFSEALSANSAGASQYQLTAQHPRVFTPLYELGVASGVMSIISVPMLPTLIISTVCII